MSGCVWQPSLQKHDIEETVGCTSSTAPRIATSCRDDVFLFLPSYRAVLAGALPGGRPDEIV